MGAKIIPLHSVSDTQQRLIEAVPRVLAREGFEGDESDKASRIADEAGVPRRLLYRNFQGLPGLLRAYGDTTEFWPSLEELMPDGPHALRDLSPDMQVAMFYKELMKALRVRTRTLDILSWEVICRNRLSRQLEHIRVRRSLEFFEHLHGDIPDEADLSALVAVLAGAASYLALRSRISKHYGGIDLASDKGWNRIDKAFERLMRGCLAQSLPRPTPFDESP